MTLPNHRMARNYLRSFKGDEINLLLAASAFNLKKMRIYFYAIFLGNASLLVLAMVNIKLLKMKILTLFIVNNVK